MAILRVLSVSWLESAVPEKKNAEIAGFVRVVALEHLANAHAMRAYAPELVKIARTCRQKWQRVQDALAADPNPSNLTLDFLAHLKGCHLEHVNQHPDRWRLLQVGSDKHLLVHEGGQSRDTFTLEEAMRALRALPDLA
jgi:hypothetical protein